MTTEFIKKQQEELVNLYSDPLEQAEMALFMLRTAPLLMFFSSPKRKLLLKFLIETDAEGDKISI